MPDIKLNLNEDDIQTIESFMQLVKKKGLETALQNMRSMARVPMHYCAADYIERIVSKEEPGINHDENVLFIGSLLVAFIHGWAAGRESLKQGAV